MSLKIIHGWLHKFMLGRPQVICLNIFLRFDSCNVSDMVIKPNHRHVDTQGLVYLPYLHSWTPASSTLQELVSVLCSVFGQNPPVYSTANSAAPSSSTRVVQSTIISPPVQYSPTPSVAGSYTQQQYQQQPPPYGASYSLGRAPVPGIVDSMHIPDYLKEGQQQHQQQQAAATVLRANVSNTDSTTSTKDRLVREVTVRLQEEILICQTRLKGDSACC